MIYDDPSSYTLREREPVLSFVGKIFDSSIFPQREMVGVFIMNVPLEMIEKQNPLSNTSMEGELTLINSKKQILYSTNQENWGKTAEPVPQSEADQYIKIKRRRHLWG